MQFNPPTSLLKTAVLWTLVLVTGCSPAASATATRPAPRVTILAPTSAPAATNLPAPTDAPTQAPADTPGAAVPAAPAELPAGANPYTGLPVDAAVLARKPVLIKVANTTEVRPQSGLSQADVVVEHLSEGSITRFTALFLGNAPTRVGSVRSCRLIDIELPVMFDAALVCSGTSPGVKPLMRDSYAHKNNVTMISDFGPFECAACPMFRTNDRPAPHNLFGNAPNTWKELDKRGSNKPSTFKSWVFSPTAGADGKATAQIDVPYKSGLVSWKYNAGQGAWLRSLSNQPQNDRETGKQLAFANVVVVYAPHITTLIQEDVTGARSIQIQVWGQGAVRVFRDGREYGGRWSRNADVGNFEFFDPAGNKIPLKPGNTWIQVVPNEGFDVPTR
jgi:Protein of unknown function (DUF3048) N-terminal domain/Protein of unknown function (DUF3048) C-terminal domain